MSKKCPKCNTLNDNNSIFCNKCGETLNNDFQKYPQTQYQPRQQNKNSNKGVAIVVIIVLLILAGIVWGAYSSLTTPVPNIEGVVLGNTTNPSHLINDTIGAIDISNQGSDPTASLIITKNTKIYKETNGRQIETDIKQISKGCKIEAYTIGYPINTKPNQWETEKIVIKE